MISATPDVEAPTDRGHLKYRPYIDGLRAVAVYLVVAFHAGLGLFNAGYLGVDVFFVLSGFLVTSILLRDLVGSGRVRWTRFYSRRVRRILPAALITLTVAALVYAIVATPVQLLEVFDGFRAASLYFANWQFIHQASDYFAPDVNTNPVLHFWSLAVEEQFYFVWPLVLGALYFFAGRLGRWRWWGMRTAVAVLAIASAIEAVHLSAADLSRAYYGTDTRAYELLAGALLALSPPLFSLRRRGWKVPVWTASALVLVLVFVSTSVLHFDAITKGILATIAASALIISLENIRGGRAKKLLSSRPVVYLGRISYGTYLWHWPVIVLVTHSGHMSPIWLFVLIVPVSTLLAAVSFRLIERPIRRSPKLDRFRIPLIAVGLAASVAVGLVVMPAILDAAPNAAWDRAYVDIPKTPICYHAPVQGCTVVRGTGARIVLIGDSHAGMYMPAFEYVARHDNLTLSVLSLPHCPWQLGVASGNHKACEGDQLDWYNRALPELKPDIVFLVHEPYDTVPRTMALPNGTRGTSTVARTEQALIDASAKTLQQLTARYPKVVIIEPDPLALIDPLSCLSTGKTSDQCSYVASTRVTPLLSYYRSRSDHKKVWSLDFNKLICPRFPKCDAIVNGLIVKRDASHLTGTYSASIGPAVNLLLHQQGVFGAPSR